MLASRKRVRRMRMLRRASRLYKDLSTSELYSYAYYLYAISKNCRDIDFPLEVAEIIGDIAKRLGKTESLSAALEGCVTDLEERGYLSLARNHLMKKYPQARYEMDEQILSKDSSSITDQELNFFRLIMAEDSNDMLSGLFAKLIYLGFFCEEDKILSSSKLSVDTVLATKIKRKYQQKINDLSDVDFLRKEVELSENELRVLQLQYRLSTFPDFIRMALDEMEMSYDDIIMAILGLTSQTYSKILRRDQKLVNYGFLEEDGCLSDDFVCVLENQNLNLYFSELIQEIDSQDAYDLESFSVAKSKTQVLSEMLRGEKPVSVLLYGKPGSGKTEYAKSLAKTTGKKVILFRNESEFSNEKNALCKLSLLLSLNRQDSILIIDEADSILTGIEMGIFGPVVSKKKGLVNKMLDNSQNKVIWIVNYIKNIDASTRRRFTMSCQFCSMPKDTLDNILLSKLEPLSLSEPLQRSIMKKFEKYNITGASVDNIVTAISSFKDADDKVLLRNTEVVLRENSLLINGANKMRCNVATSYDSSVLNTSMGAESIVKMLKNAKSFAKKNRMGSGMDTGVRMLFYGVSGTGKTEFARYLSQMLGKKILLKRVSDIMSKWLGETEGNIAKAFAEATERDMILLFDEADSFFADRNNAERSWERTSVNEFLTQMEEFPGILICTTNLKHILDKASLRRFHITVEFKPMEEAGIKTLLEKFFPAYFPKGSLSQDGSQRDGFQEKRGEVSLSKLLRYNSVTPGDFSRLAGKIRFMDEEDISAQMIVDELCAIQEEKDLELDGRVGFAV